MLSDVKRTSESTLHSSPPNAIPDARMSEGIATRAVSPPPSCLVAVNGHVAADCLT